MEPRVQHTVPITKRVPFEFERLLAFLSRHRTSIQTEAKLFSITGYDVMGMRLFPLPLKA